MSRELGPGFVGAVAQAFGVDAVDAIDGVYHARHWPVVASGWR